MVEKRYKITVEDLETGELNVCEGDCGLVVCGESVGRFAACLTEELIVLCSRAIRAVDQTLDEIAKKHNIPLKTLHELIESVKNEFNTGEWS